MNTPISELNEVKSELAREREYHDNTKKELELANDEIAWLYARGFWSRIFNVTCPYTDTTNFK